LNLAEYQQFTATTAIYPKDNALVYLSLGLTSEAGEVAGKIKKIVRDNVRNDKDIISEVGDVFWYLCQLCTALNVEAADVIEQNMNKLIDRQERDVIKGNGDNR
jgi:NTP pyrophosphatase (non-canonical NTP hydrolase)